MILVEMSMVQLHLLPQDDQNEVKHDFCGHVVPLTLASHDSILTAMSMAPLHFLGQTIKMRCNMIFWSFDATGSSISVK